MPAYYFLINNFLNAKMIIKKTAIRILLLFSCLLIVHTLFLGCRHSEAVTDHRQWFAFSPTSSADENAISLFDWTPTPSQKIWGTNVNYSHNAPSKAEAVQRARFFKKYGINSVRLHKLANHGWRGLGSDQHASEYDKDKLDRFDFWTSQLKRQQISYHFSPIWQLMVYPSDAENLLSYEDIVANNPAFPVTTGLVWFAPDIQKLHIEAITNLLNHKNPYTDKRYADDKHLAFIEIQNEENIFFYTFTNTLNKMPRYQRLAAEQFSDWLLVKYQTHHQLVSAWGASAVDTFANEGGLPNENLYQKNIVPVLTPWLYDNHRYHTSRGQRLRDTAEFLLYKQSDYFSKAIKAIRATGYQGKIITSNWQAGQKGTHFLNLFSDRQGDIIDRHNYMGGAVGLPAHTAQSGHALYNHTMLDDPGSGLLSTGMQQVANYPFMVSEWLSVLPTEWAAADTAILAAYGWGLQGWDASYHFASDGQSFTPSLSGGTKFNTLNPVGVGLYPILSRMVLRGDIKEAEPIAIRRLTQAQAFDNRYDFDNIVTQSGDLKSLSGTPHHQALAAGKVLIEFTQQTEPSSIQDWENTYKTNNADGSTTISASTQQLAWTYSDKKYQGYVTINSKGTQGIIGFHPQRRFDFDDMQITPQSPYSVILATARSQYHAIANDNSVLLLAMARAHNTDMQLTDTQIINMGTAPILLEPVKALVAFKRQKGTVTVLDHDGNKTDNRYPLIDGEFTLDTARDKAIYYLVEFDVE